MLTVCRSIDVEVALDGALDRASGRAPIAVVGGCTHVVHARGGYRGTGSAADRGTDGRGPSAACVISDHACQDHGSPCTLTHPVCSHITPSTWFDPRHRLSAIRPPLATALRGPCAGSDDAAAVDVLVRWMRTSVSLALQLQTLPRESTLSVILVLYRGVARGGRDMGECPPRHEKKNLAPELYRQMAAFATGVTRQTLLKPNENVQFQR